MFRIETYENPKLYFENLEYKEDELHITGTSPLAMHIKEYLNSGNCKNRVWTHSHLEKAIYKEWHLPINELKMKIEIRNLLDNYEEEETVKSLKSDIDNVFDTCKYLIEIGIKKLTISDELRKDQLLFRKIFNEFCKLEIVENYDRFSKIKKDGIIENLNKYYVDKFSKDRELDESVKIKDIKTIYVYNFNYINLCRYLFFRRMKFIGIEIVFRIPYYEPYEKLSKPWKDLYFNRALIESLDDVSKEKGNAGIELYFNRYLKYMEGKLSGEKLVDIDRKIDFKRFSQPIEFKNFIKENRLIQNQKQLEKYLEKQDMSIDEYKKRLEKPNENESQMHKYVREYISFSKDELNRYMKYEIIDRENRLSHFFDYPQGKFLKSVYDCRWNEDENDLELDYKTFVNCITSGWIEIGGNSKDRLVSGSETQDILKDLEPYMDGVESINGIKSRFESLIGLNEFGDVFDEMSKQKTGRDRVKRYLSNPLKVLPYLNWNRYAVTLKQLIRLVDKFEKTVSDLVPKDNIVVVNEHMRQLEELWESLSLVRNASGETLYEKVKKGLRYREDNDKLDVETYEMRQFLNIVMNFNSDDTSEDESGSKGDNLIKAFDQLEGIVINGTERICFTDFSNKSYEKYIRNRKFVPSYITIEELDEEIQNIDGKEKKKILNYGLKLTQKSEENKTDFVKFYIVYLLSFFEGELHMSWIDGINDHDTESSIYSIIKNLYEMNDTNEKFEYSMDVDGKLEKAYERLNRGAGVKKTKVDFAENIAPISYLDMDICPNKFYYSSILNFNPVYTEDFHQRMVFSILGNMFKRFLSQEDVEGHFFELFPQWNDTLKRNLIATSYSKDPEKEYRFNNIIFPYHMKDLQILRTRVSDNRSVKNSYKNQNLDNDKYMKQFLKDDVHENMIKSESGKHCMMCPHNMICSKGVFGVE